MDKLEVIKNIPYRYCKGINQCVDIILKENVPNLEAIILFGSCSRGELRGMSDIDIAIVTKEILTDRAVRGAVSCELEFLDNNLNADVVFLSEKTWREGDSILHKDIRKDGIILWEGGKFTDDEKQLSLRCKK